MADRKHQPGRLRRRVNAWAEQHARALIGALGRYRESLAPSLMTTAVIGIALALPVAFLLVLDNVESLAGGWEGRTRASLFLSRDIESAGQRQLVEHIRRRGDVAAVELIGRDEALAEFRRHSGLDEALDLLGENPLPAVIVVEPAQRLEPAQIDALASALEQRPEVDRLRLDRTWVRRLHAIMQLAERAVWIVVTLLGVTAVLVVGNTIRLDIENRRDEIVITKLIGATDAFVRRPFLYSGLWYGVAGGLLSSALLMTTQLLLSGPASTLAELYESGFRAQGIGLSGVLTLVGGGALLGLLGSWTAVGRHLARIEPR